MASLIDMPNGSQENPVYLSVSSVARLGDEQFEAVMDWVAAERDKRAARQAESERELEAFKAEATARLERVHAAEQVRKETPAKLGDLA
jgi:hypothetical protein